MTDVLRLALDRRAELHEEVARIDEFIRMADALLHKLQPRSGAHQKLRPESRPGPHHEHHELRPGPHREPAGAADGHEASVEPHPAFRDAPAVPPREIAPGVTRMNLIRRGVAAANG